MWLNKRQKSILTKLIEIYISTQKPVSSSQFKDCFSLAESTIRKELQELERNNFVTKLHVSSGRIPSNKGLKAYISTIYENNDFGFGVKNYFPAKESFDFNETSQKMLSQLSINTQNLGFVLLSSLLDLKYKKIRFVKVSIYKILAVIKTENNWNYTKAFVTSRNYSESELKNWESILNNKFNNCSISVALKKIHNRIYAEKTQYLTMYKGLCGLLKSEELLTAELFFKGEEYIYNLGMKNAMRMKELLIMIEQKERFSCFIKDFLKKSNDKSGPSVIFGTESGIPAFSDLILIFSGIYSKNRNRMGNVGVIGPRYMEYTNIFFEINQMSKYFSTAVINQ